MGDRDRGDRGRDRERSDSRGKGDARGERAERGGDRGADRGDRGGGDRGGDRGEDRQGSTCSLLVRNLSYRVRADEIKRIMTRYGEVRDVYIPQVIQMLFSF